jgi:hypothetical protein
MADGQSWYDGEDLSDGERSYSRTASGTQSLQAASMSATRGSISGQGGQLYRVGVQYSRGFRSETSRIKPKSGPITNIYG